MAKRDCPNCAAWKSDKRGKMTGFSLDGVTWHWAPDIWLASRTIRFGDGKEALLAAMRAWAEQCELERRYHAQKEVAA